MLVTFTTKAYANITMFGDVAIRLLGLMGHSGTVPSALAADDVPEALRRLREAVESQSSDRSDLDDGGEEDTVDDADQVHVSLKHRAFPLIQLLEAAARDRVPVTWEM
jgi:hypothetical protein